MSAPIYNRNEILLPWAAERIGVKAFKSDARAIGWKMNGEVVAVVVYESITINDCSMHIASNGKPGWLSIEFIIHFFSYPFSWCGFTRVTALIVESNIKAIRFCKHIGFKEEGRLRKKCPNGEDVLIFGMLREECRYLAAKEAA